MVLVMGMYTINNDCSNEIIIKNSKFICILKEIYSVSDVEKVLNNIKLEYKDATHYTYAYIIDNNKKFSDDNEPSGTAGSPIMQVLEKNNLNYVLCIVIRYFGGIKLGASGLVRAYSKSISECLKKTNLSKLIKGYNIDISFSYDLSSKIDYLLKDYQIINKTYKDNITYTLNIEKNMLDTLSNINNINIKIIKETLLKK